MEDKKISEEIDEILSGKFSNLPEQSKQRQEAAFRLGAKAVLKLISKRVAKAYKEGMHELETFSPDESWKNGNRCGMSRMYQDIKQICEQ